MQRFNNRSQKLHALSLHENLSSKAQKEAR